MGIAEFYYLEGGLFFGFLTATGLTVIGLSRPDYRVAKRCAWAAAILLGSIAIVWGLTTTESAWIRIPGVGIVGLLAAISLTEALRFIKVREFPPAVEARAVPRGPTLEATNRSAIDASGATIPGDLPFQFGNADNNSIIEMPGIVVTKNGDGSMSISPGHNVSREFPAPTGEFATMPIPELRKSLNSTATDLRHLQDDFSKEFSTAIKSLPDHSQVEVVSTKYVNLYEERFSKTALSLASAALSKIGSIDGADMPRQAQLGGSVVYFAKFVGPMPGQEAAGFLEYLSSTTASQISAWYVSVYWSCAAWASR
jgi:hypothetical protein